MSITIDGIKLGSLSLEKDRDKGSYKVTGSYELISNTGLVLARQDFNTYNGMTIAHGRDTSEHLNKLVEALQQDIKSTIGI